MVEVLPVSSAAAHPDHVRWALFQRLFWFLVGLDVVFNFMSHGGRYGVGGFNVAHFRWLDALQPVPRASHYLFVLMGAAVSSLTAALVRSPRPWAVSAAVFFTYGWMMSVLDSYQHHYLMSWLLVLFACEPVRSENLFQATTTNRVTPFGYWLACWLCAAVYGFTAVTKADEGWLSGQVLATLGENDVDSTIAWVRRWSGLSALEVYAVAARLALAAQVMVCAVYLVAPLRERFAWVRYVRWMGALVAITFHLGVIPLGLEIGWFTWYSVFMALAFLGPDVPWAWVRGVYRGWGRMGSRVGFGSLKLSFAYRIALSSLAGVGVVVMCRWMSMPGVMLFGLVMASLLLVVGILNAMFERGMESIVVPTVSVAICCVVCILEPVQFDFFRRYGYALSKAGDHGAALDAYEQGERFAPRGKSRKRTIQKLRRTLGR